MTATLWLAEPGEVNAVLNTGTQGPLHADDLAAAKGKHLDGDRRLIRTSRWLARAAVSGRANIPAPALVLSRHQSGLPHVAAPPEATDIAYSVSHTDGLIAVLEGRCQSVGVDVEGVDPTIDVAELGQVVLGSTEQATLADVAPADRVLAFFRLWVVKEAVLKALGTGFHTDPAEVAVQMMGDRAHVEVAPHVVEALDITPRPQWAITIFEAGAGHVGATAVAWPGSAAPEVSLGDWHELLDHA